MFWKSKKKEYGTIFYHEDDYCQVQLLPKENYFELLKQAENVDDFSEEHFDGTGFTDIMVRDESTFKLCNKSIQIKELDGILESIELPKHIEVSTGITPSEMESKNTIGYGENYNGIFYDFEDGIVQNIWSSNLVSLDSVHLQKALNQIGVKWKLLLMDWNSLTLVDLQNTAQIEKYFS